MAQVEDITDRIGGRQRHRRGADDAGIEEGQCKQHRGDLPGISFEADSDAPGIAERAEFGAPGKGCGGERHQRHRTDGYERDADPQIGALVGDEARRDALVDDIALLKEQLPGRHCGTDDGNDKQHHLTQRAAMRQPRDQEVADHLADWRMDHDKHRDEQ